VGFACGSPPPYGGGLGGGVRLRLTATLRRRVGRWVRLRLTATLRRRAGAVGFACGSPPPYALAAVRLL